MAIDLEMRVVQSMLEADVREGCDSVMVATMTMLTVVE